MVKIVPLPQRQRKVVTTTQIVPVNNASMSVVSGKTLRNRRRRARRRALAPYVKPANPLALAMNNAPYTSANTQGVKSQFTAAPSYSLGVQGYHGEKQMQEFGHKISADGMKFLKCAFAPPDFAGSDIKGVPDSYNGSSLIKKHRLTQSIVNSAGRDTYLLLLPVPGIACYRIDLAAGANLTSSDQFDPVFYSDCATMFPNGADTTLNFNSFRYISNHIELVPTVNATQWAGSITAWKLPIAVVTRSGIAGVGSGLLTVTGLQAVNATNVNMYSGPICNGIYSGCYSGDSSFRFTNIIDDASSIPSTIQGGDFGRLRTGIMPNSTQAMGVTGFDNAFECLVVKISNNSSTLNNSFVLRSYACVEYKVSPGSALKEFESVSPCEDEEALKLYRAIVNELPVGVHYLDNDTFWQRVLDIIARLGMVGSNLPGPYGMISAGVGGIAAGIRNLTM